MLTGSQTPRLSSIPEYEKSLWTKIAPALKKMKFSVDEWQADILTAAFGLKEGGKFAAPNVLLIVPRQ